jgi:hypothetical protein
MALWRVAKEWKFDAPQADPGVEGTDTSGGYGYLLEHVETGEESEFRILVARGPSNLPPVRVHEVLRKYLDDPTPPQSVTLDRSGGEIS